MAVELVPNYSSIYAFEDQNWSMEVAPACRPAGSVSPNYVLHPDTNTATIHSYTPCWALFASISHNLLGEGTFELSFSCQGGEWALFDKVNVSPPGLSNLFLVNQPNQRFQFELQEGSGSELVLGFYHSTSTYTIGSFTLQRLSPSSGILPLAVLGQSHQKSPTNPPRWTTSGKAEVGMSGNVYTGYLEFTGAGSATTPIRTNGWYLVSGLASDLFGIEIEDASMKDFWSNSTVLPDPTTKRFTVKVPMVHNGFFKVTANYPLNFQIHTLDPLLPLLPSPPPKPSVWAKPWVRYTLIGTICVLVILLIVLAIHKSKKSTPSFSPLPSSPPSMDSMDERFEA